MDNDRLAGVYTAFDANAVYTLEGCDAVVVGTAMTARRAVDALATRCLRVVWLTGSLHPRTTHPNVRILRDIELLSVDGVARVECVLLVRKRTGRVLAMNASAVFLLRNDRESLRSREKPAQP